MCSQLTSSMLGRRE
uniref:Uncharacterized protein n=1 Tax=Arundo donax TaxID=35708 RepID=A0A0A9GKI6_ARUDO